MIHEMIGCYANTWIRQKRFNKAGETSVGHKHKYDHVSILASGHVSVNVDGKIKEFKAPTFIIIRADKEHKITALTEDVLWYCVFANRDLDGNVYDPESNDPLDEECHGFEQKIKDIKDISIEV